MVTSDPDFSSLGVPVWVICAAIPNFAASGANQDINNLIFGQSLICYPLVIVLQDGSVIRFCGRYPACETPRQKVGNDANKGTICSIPIETPVA